MRVTLNEILPAAAAQQRAVAAFNIFGLDEAVRVVAGAEAQNQPVILLTSKDVLRHIPVEVLGPALRALADRATVPVCVHLDHTSSAETVYRAITAGYSSVMFDGSQLPFDENVTGTRRVVEVAHATGVSVEGEIGSVSYNEPGSSIRHQLTDPEEAARFARETGVDALAVSVGTIHKLNDTTAEIDFIRLEQIAAALEATDRFGTGDRSASVGADGSAAGYRTGTPLVIHGTSGVAENDLRRLARGPVAKFNIGTLLRRAWGTTLRYEMGTHPEAFDRSMLTSASLDAIQAAAERMIAILARP